MDVLNLQFDYRQNNLNLNYELFYNQMLNIIHKYRPQVEIVEGKEKYKLWINEIVMNPVVETNRAFKKHIFTEDIRDWDDYK